MVLQQGMQALLDLIFAVEGSVADAAKYLGYLIYALISIIIISFVCVSLIYAKSITKWIF
jgi:hypothetical protein